MTYSIKKNFPNIYTTGRSGSSICAELVNSNLGIKFEEWFSPNRYNFLLSKGIYTNKSSYLLYVFFLLQGGDSKKGIKITPHVFASDYWEQNITANPIFIESAKVSDDAILLIRQNPLDTIKSYIYSGITGNWHSDQPIVPGKNLSDEELFKYANSRSLYILKSEIRLIHLVNELHDDFKLFFYEDINVNREQFMCNLLSCFTEKPFLIDHLVIPKMGKLTKEHLIEEKIEVVLQQVISGNEQIQTLLKERDFMLKAYGALNRLHSS